MQVGSAIVFVTDGLMCLRAYVGYPTNRLRKYSKTCISLYCSRLSQRQPLFHFLSYVYINSYVYVCNIEQPEALRLFTIRIRISRAVAPQGGP
jgi:hypothetical protein